MTRDFWRYLTLVVVATVALFAGLFVVLASVAAGIPK